MILAYLLVPAAIALAAVIGFAAGAESRDKEVAQLIESRTHDAIEIEELGEMVKLRRMPSAKVTSIVSATTQARP